MDEPRQRKRRPLGCALIAVVLVGAVVGVGLWMGRVDDASKAPCARYAETVARALDNCHSGQNRSHSHHVGLCEEALDPTPACLQRIEALTCDELEVGPAVAAGEVCRRAPRPAAP